MEVIAYNIEYDTDGLEVSLPNQLTFAVSSKTEIGDIPDIIADRISNETGYCHKGFQLKID